MYHGLERLAVCLGVVAAVGGALGAVAGADYGSDVVVDLGCGGIFVVGLVIAVVCAYWGPVCACCSYFVWGSAVPVVADGVVVGRIPRGPHNVIEVMVGLMALLLGLKLVQSGVHHTCRGGHDIVCTPPPPNFYVKNKLKSEIFNDKKNLRTKMFFYVITKNLN